MSYHFYLSIFLNIFLLHFLLCQKFIDIPRKIYLSSFYSVFFYFCHSFLLFFLLHVSSHLDLRIILSHVYLFHFFLSIFLFKKMIFFLSFYLKILVLIAEKNYELFFISLFLSFYIFSWIYLSFLNNLRFTCGRNLPFFQLSFFIILSVNSFISLKVSIYLERKMIPWLLLLPFSVLLIYKYPHLYNLMSFIYLYIYLLSFSFFLFYLSFIFFSFLFYKYLVNCLYDFLFSFTFLSIYLFFLFSFNEFSNFLSIYLSLITKKYSKPFLHFIFQISSVFSQRFSKFLSFYYLFSNFPFYLSVSIY
ncbi:unnamed protein product [Acanthosepion pharaonis]|uniref:Uncharacterized protein n=1 Tax=Acanthosepion pharaonis TaxID=158019 RepID=A0A812CWL3_ACAPH|nr:unnamed protein product [Sepia pharaonis]